ncbi:class I adenylate-forming enzyme family protein [Amycolatopsis saalfeldensis]|uniref:Long-chain-fatty-acid--CoA ligase n=1 Tax=Amycolatopsis saalfeldensis TaxID=394193 RepID=A0A1H8WXC8_9PSEU|nr:fatty acid--CoA ligase family protein [Amycolatopsis saalfeldensis]SEP32345.1 Acyl-CoA synthetase (AMP-forming)/AMP-acid ligase II [Amycolatopsis saalfeldensis]
MVYPQGLLDALAREPGKPAFEHGPRVVGRGETLELIGRFTAALRGAGLGPGDGVGIATGVTPEGWAVQIAAQVLGCRAVGVRPGLPAAHLREVVADLAAVVVDEQGESPELRATGAEILPIGPSLPAYEEPVPQGRPEDIGWVVFTSGSTGVPKGVAFSFAALGARGPEYRGPAGWDVGDAYRRFLLFGTLTSAVMVMHLEACLLAGGTAVIPAALPDFPWVLPRLDITAALMTVPRLYQVLDVLRGENVDLSGLRALTVAGSPVAPGLMAEAFERIGPGLQQGYGQTETGKLTILTAEDVARHPSALGSVGRPLVSVEVREDSEVYVRTPTAFAGYWNNPDLTASVLRDGWVRTQDVGRLDAEGFLHLTGRARDVVIVNAIIHYAGPIERALASGAGVDQAYVVGAPDERTGEAMHAFLVASPGGSPDFGELRALVAAELGDAAVPATFRVIDSVPVAASGKPAKAALLSLL